MEQATVKRAVLPNIVIALAAFGLALVLAFKTVTVTPRYDAAGTSAPAADRIMTDEVQSIKVGKFTWGDPKPHGGLVELKSQVAAKDFSGAAQTIKTIKTGFAPVLAELQRRAEANVDHSQMSHEEHMTAEPQTGSKAAGLFEANLNTLARAVSARQPGAAQAGVGKAFGLWAGVEADLARTSVDAGVLGQTVALFLLAWIVLTVILTVAADRGRAAGPAEVPASAEIGGLDLTRSRLIKALLVSPVFPAALQAFSLIFLVLVVIIGATGPVSTSENLATVLIWSLWWSPLMITSLLAFGKVWCGACPIGAVTTIVERLGAKKRSPDFTSKAGFGLLALTPIAISLFGFILMRMPLYGVSYAITQLPLRTSLYFGVWIMLAIGVSLVYERRAWCRYWCPVSAATSVIAKLAPVDFVHAKASGVTNCSTLEYGGNYLTSDRRCLYCLKCTQAYPDAPVYARLRLPGAGLLRERHIFGEAAMALILLAVFPIGHGLGQLPFFSQDPLMAELRVAYFAAIAGCLAVYGLVSKIGARLSGTDFRESFARYGGAYMPMGILFSLGMSVTAIMRSAGNWLNVTAPVFGIYRYWSPALADQNTIAAWQHWSMSWMTPIGGAWGLVLIWALARRNREPAAGWLPHAALITAFVIVAKLLPMPMH